jgi:hypothetical protein
MAMPKKVKYSIDTNPTKIGNNYLEYGFERIAELMRLTDEKTKYLPRTIMFEDLDFAVSEFVDEGNLKLVIDGKKVPCFYMLNERWGEFERTWKFMDGDNNVPTPYITVRRIEKKIGTRLGNRSLIPQLKRFSYYDVPILDEGEVIYLRFKTPEPINVDLTYEISLFTKYAVDANMFDEIIFKEFAAKQSYVFIDGNPMPLVLDSNLEANTIENIDNDKFFVSKYNITIKGFIRNEEDFQIVKTYRSPKFTLVSN